MSKNDLDKLREELDGWRTRLDQLRLQANLGKMELRDKLQELGERIEPAHRRAMKRLSELAKDGASEAQILSRSLQAGWDQLRRTHRDLSRESEQEQAERKSGPRSR